MHLCPRDMAEVRAVLAHPSRHDASVPLIQVAWDVLKDARGQPIPIERWDRLRPAHLVERDARPAFEPLRAGRNPRPGLVAHFAARMGRGPGDAA